MARKCPALCGTDVPAGKLMCPRHWRRVPKDLQDEVYRTWRAWRRDLSNGDLMLAYEDASTRAVQVAAG